MLQSSLSTYLSKKCGWSRVYGFFAPCAVGGSKGQAGFRLCLSLPCPLAVRVSLWPSQPCSRGANFLLRQEQRAHVGHEQEWPKHLKSPEASNSIYCKLRHLPAWSRSCGCSTVQHSPAGSCGHLPWAGPAAPAARLLSGHVLVCMCALLRCFSVNDVL